MSYSNIAFALARRPHPIYMLGLAALILACNAGPGASPPPSSRPTPSPTATPVPSPTFNPEQISHPTGATDVVLRMEQGGGFVPFEWLVTQAPQFTLYGDGTVVFRPIEDAQRQGFDQGLPRFLTGKMSEEGIQALLSYALSTGRLASARDQYDNQQVADASTTVFMLNAGGVEKVVSIYALFEAFEPGPDAADRQGFSQLQNLLMNFEQEARSGTLDQVALYEPALYEPALYRVVLLEGNGAAVAPPVAWPWDDISLADFPIGDEPGNRSKNLTAEQVSELVEVPSGGQMGIWVEAPDGTLVSFAIRPLLPDEAAGLPEG